MDSSDSERPWPHGGPLDPADRKPKAPRNTGSGSASSGLQPGSSSDKTGGGVSLRGRSEVREMKGKLDKDNITLVSAKLQRAQSVAATVVREKSVSWDHSCPMEFTFSIPVTMDEDNFKSKMEQIDGILFDDKTEYKRSGNTGKKPDKNGREIECCEITVYCKANLGYVTELVNTHVIAKFEADMGNSGQHETLGAKQHAKAVKSKWQKKREAQTLDEEIDIFTEMVEIEREAKLDVHDKRNTASPERAPKKPKESQEQVQKTGVAYKPYQQYLDDIKGDEKWIPAKWQEVSQWNYFATVDDDDEHVESTTKKIWTQLNLLNTGIRSHSRTSKLDRQIPTSGIS